MKHLKLLFYANTKKDWLCQWLAKSGKMNLILILNLTILKERQVLGAKNSPIKTVSKSLA